MTDVTGFGIAGHLKEMLSGTHLKIQWADQIRVFQGVDECVNRGVRSSAHIDNKGYAGQIGYGAPSLIIFDPQTCGPLMIAAGPRVAKKVVQKWIRLGLSPQCIGTLTTETS